MSFRITGLSPEPFAGLYGLPDQALAGHGVRRVVADACPGYPDRVGLTDARMGETLLLLNYVHQAADTPFRASHAIYVREGAIEPYDRRDELPEVMRLRPISLRAFAADHFLVDAALGEGAALPALIESLLGQDRVSYLQAHFARPGCYAARIERA